MDPPSPSLKRSSDTTLDPACQPQTPAEVNLGPFATAATPLLHLLCTSVSVYLKALRGAIPPAMTATLSNYRSNFETSFTIDTFTPPSYTMSSGGRGYDYGSYTSRAYDSRSNGYYRTGSDIQDSGHGHRNTGLIPGYADMTSGRRSMNIEDILNPSEENTRRHQQPQSSRSYDAGTQGNRAPRSGPHSHRANGSARSRGGSRPPPPHMGSRSSDVPSRTRAFRPGYTDEQEHFIWYLRIDVRL